MTSPKDEALGALELAQKIMGGDGAAELRLTAVRDLVNYAKARVERIAELKRPRRAGKKGAAVQQASQAQ